LCNLVCTLSSLAAAASTSGLLRAVYEHRVVDACEELTNGVIFLFAVHLDGTMLSCIGVKRRAVILTLGARRAIISHADKSSLAKASFLMVGDGREENLVPFRSVCSAE
jgi:hypothetical protein